MANGYASSCPGLAPKAMNVQRDQAGHGRRRRDGTSRSPEPAQQERVGRRLAGIVLQPPVVADEHQAVAHCDAEDGEHAEPRSQRQRVTGDARRQQATRRRDERRQQAQCREAPAAEPDLQEQEHADQRGDAERDQPPDRLCVLAEHLGVVLERQRASTAGRG